MTTLTPAFRTETRKIQKEHRAIGRVLQDLDAALDHMVCYSEVFADLATAGDVRRHCRTLADEFPEHCRREENLLFGAVRDVSPELAEFCNEMREQHTDLLQQLNTFCGALEEFDRDEDLYDAVCHLKEEGKKLTRKLRSHVAIEEQELGGFL